MNICIPILAIFASSSFPKQDLPDSVLQRAQLLLRALTDAKEGTAMGRALRNPPSVNQDSKFPALYEITFLDPLAGNARADITFDRDQTRFVSFFLHGRPKSPRSQRAISPEEAMRKAQEVYEILGGQGHLGIAKAEGLYDPQWPGNPDLILPLDMAEPTPIYRDDRVQIHAYQFFNKIPFTLWCSVAFSIDMKRGRIEWMSIPELPKVIPAPSQVLSKLAYRSIAEREVADTLKGLQIVEEKAFQLWYWDDSIDLTAVHNEDYRPEWRTRPARLVYEGTYTDTDGDRGVRIAYDAVTGEQLGRISFNRNSGFGTGGHRKPLAPFTFDLDAGSITVRSQEKETVVRGAVARSGTPSRIPTNSVPITLERGRLRLLVDFYPELGLLRTGTQWGRPDAPLLKSLTEFARRRPSG